MCDMSGNVYLLCLHVAASLLPTHVQHIAASLPPTHVQHIAASLPPAHEHSGICQHREHHEIRSFLILLQHECLYSNDVPPGVRHVHIQLVAKELPAQDFVDEVCRVANAFWSECPNLYIAIHCAYGEGTTIASFSTGTTCFSA
jgi:hypothetical protein